MNGEILRRPSSCSYQNKRNREKCTCQWVSKCMVTGSDGLVLIQTKEIEKNVNELVNVW